ncbi:MAG: hypothetical protein K2K54_04945 [Lachnospiraceae bacterium]|nr:hypothetical protein [Lachnospiraceae bacterium]
MNKKSKAENKNGKEYAVDIVKDILAWLVVTAIAFVYSMAMLLLVSLFLVNVWHVTFEEIVNISIVLMAIVSVGYIGVLIYRRRH